MEQKIEIILLATAAPIAAAFAEANAAAKAVCLDGGRLDGKCLGCECLDGGPEWWSWRLRCPLSLSSEIDPGAPSVCDFLRPSVRPSEAIQQ